jgi:hypothetical protein
MSELNMSKKSKRSRNPILLLSLQQPFLRVSDGQSPAVLETTDL